MPQSPHPLILSAVRKNSLLMNVVTLDCSPTVSEDELMSDDVAETQACTKLMLSSNASVAHVV